VSKTSFAALKQQLRETQTQLDYYKGLVGAFSTGEVPSEGASLQHFIFAQWGRKRQAELQHVPVLLRGEVEPKGY
jgi:hypothetical protein